MALLLSAVIPAKAGIQRLSRCSEPLKSLGPEQRGQTPYQPVGLSAKRAASGQRMTKFSSVDGMKRD